MNIFEMQWTASLICILQMVCTLEAAAIDNSIVGTPMVECERDFVRFAVNTEKPFKGKVFVKGEYNNEKCVRNFARTPTDDGQSQAVEGRMESMLQRGSGVTGQRSGGLNGLLNGGLNGGMNGNEDSPQCPPCPVCESITRRARQTTSAGIDIKLGTCNAKRDRTVSPPGITISFTVVVSFHENFVTKIDRAYRIQCAYLETDKLVTAEIDVSMPQSTELSGEIESPKCEYRIKGTSGEPIRNVRVGDMIEHEWTCSGGVQGIHSMLVSNCYAEGGGDQKELVIDSRGCSMDTFVIPTPHYESAAMKATSRAMKATSRAMKATSRAMVFKFPDHTHIGFQCDILVCVKGEQKCDQITPPKCDGARRRRDLMNATRLAPTWRLHTDTLNVIDIDEPVADDELAALNRLTAHLGSSLSAAAPFCVSIMKFGLIIAMSTFFLTISTATVIFLLFFKDPLRK